MAKKGINTELKELIAICPGDKQGIAGRLADELIFMHKTLTELKKQVNNQGPVEEFQNGKQKFLRESAALKAYNITLKSYTQAYKQLTDLLPKSVQAENSSAVYEFLKESNF